MTKVNEIYKCNVCNNVVELTSVGGGILVCCGEDMEPLTPNQTKDNDPHYAHLEKNDDITYKVTFNHPMTQEHYIEYVEVISTDEKFIIKKYLNISESPEMTFKYDYKENFYIRLYCNIHNNQETRY